MTHPTRSTAARGRLAGALRPHPLTLALACALAGAAPAGLSQAQTLPTGGTVARGQASIVTQGNLMTVTNSPNAVLNWQSFSIGAGQTVRFEQANASSQVLNRVLGRDPSMLAGRLSSNGTVWLLNPYGVLFGRDARVDVAGLVASTLNISDADFQARRFNLLGGNTTGGQILNQGEIRTTLGGQVLLVGGQGGVRNEGLIEAPGGQVLLAAGASVDLADSSSPQMAVRVSAPAGEVLNLGRLLSPGGRIDLQAAMVNQQGIVRADSLSGGPAGEVRLNASGTLDLVAGSVTSADGGQGGRIEAQGSTHLVAGAVSAQGAEGAGGSVRLLGREVGLLAGSEVNASGRSGGGEVLVGGGVQGRDASVPNARAVYMDTAARVRADALDQGTGGRIVLWSDQATRAYGTLSARGGPRGGDGGFIETSGGWLDARPASVRTDAPKGAAGLWLLDPNDILISDFSVSNDNVTSGPNFRSTGDSATIDTATIVSALEAGNNVTVTTDTQPGSVQGGSITMQGSMTVNASSAVGLTLNAARHITLDHVNIFSPDAPLDLTLNAGTAGQGSIRVVGSSISTSGNILLGGPSIACGTAGCAPFAGAVATSDPGRGFGVDIVGSSLTANQITMRGTSAIDGQVHGGVRVDSSSELSALRIDLAGWTGSDALHDQVGASVSGLFKVYEQLSIDGTSRVNGPGSVEGTALGVELDSSSYVLVGPTAVDGFNPGFAALASGNRRALAADPNRWLRITGRSDERSGMFSNSVSLGGGYVQVTDKAGISIVGDGGPVYVGSTGFDASLAGNLLASGTGRLTMAADDLLVPAGEPVRLTNSGGVDLHASMVGTPSEFTVDTSGIVRLGNGFTAFTLDMGTAPVTLRGAGLEAGVDGENILVQSGTTRLQSPSHQIGASTTFQASAPGDAIIVAGLSGNASSVLVAGTSSPLVATNGRWLVYGVNPADSANFQFGGLVRDFTQYDAVAGTSAVLGTGNGLLFSLAPLLQVNATVTGPTSKVYDGSASTVATAGTPTIVGLVPGDVLSSPATLGPLRYASSNAGSPIPFVVPLVGALPPVVDGNARPVYGYRYTGTVLGAQGSISPRAVSVQAGAALDKVYDGTRDVQLQGATLTGLLAGESLTVLPGTLAFDDPNAGLGKSISGTVVLADGTGGLASNYQLAAGGQLVTSANITPRPVSIVGAAVADKVYDGTVAATVSGGSVAGLVEGQSLTVVSGGLNFDTRNVGVNKTVSGQLALADGPGGQGLASNYSLTNGGALSLTGNILPRPLSFASASAASKVYDGTTAATMQVGALQGLVDGESLGTTVVGRFQTSQVGNDKPVFGAVTLSNGAGGLASNYVFPGGGFNVRASITPRPVTVEGLTSLDKVYDGTRDVVLKDATLSGVLPDERLTLTPGTLAFDSPNVGTGKVLVGNLGLADGPGGRAANYQLVGGGAVSTRADITPRPITVTGATVADKLYDGNTDATVTGGTLTGLVAGQTLTLTTGVMRFDTRHAGNNKVVSGTLDLADGTGSSGGLASNYTLTNGSTLLLSGNILPRPVSFASTAVDGKVYDGSTAATSRVGALQGVLPGESIGATVDARFQSADVGTDKPVFGAVTLVDGAGGLAANYVFPGGGFPARATITPRPVTVQGVSAADRPYDGTTQAGLVAQSFLGLVPGETLTLASQAAFDSKAVGSGKTVTGQVALADGSGRASNYSLVNPGAFTGTASIVPRGLTVTGALVADKVYDGNTSTSASGFVLSGVLPGEQVSVASGTGRYADPDVGSGKSATATATSLTGADGANYSLASPSVQTSGSITPATAVYVARATVAEIGQALPGLRGRVDGLVAGETLQTATSGELTFTTTATPASPLGVYPMVGSGLTARNYVFTQSPDNATALTVVRLSTSTIGQQTSTVPTVPAMMAAIQPPPVVSSVAAHRTLDALPAMQSAPGGMAFRTIDLDGTAQQDVASMLAARDRYKKGIFAEAIGELERNPGLADAPACQSVEQAAAGNCLITEALKPALRARLQIEMQLAQAPQPAAAPAAAAAPPAPAAPAPAAPVIASPTPAVAPPPAVVAAAVPRAQPAPVLRLPQARAVRRAALPQIERKWALLIGTDVYADVKIPQLDNAVADVNAVASVLEDKLGYQTLVVRNGSKAEILRAFNQLAAVVSPSDSVAIYYAGHGELVEKLNLGFWQPTDADATKAETWISNTDIGKLLGQLGASQVVLVSDSCFSGSLVSDERIRAGSTVPDAAALLSRRAAVVMSSGGNEPVFDSGKNGHSTFAWSFMQALGNVASWRPGSNVFEQVRFAVARQVPQRPQYGASKLGGHQTGADYVFEQRQLDSLSK